VGILLDLDGLEGFIDVTALPADPGAWPPVGTVLDVEILQHRPSQVRVWPLQQRFQRDRPMWEQRRAANLGSPKLTCVGAAAYRPTQGIQHCGLVRHGSPQARGLQMWRTARNSISDYPRSVQPRYNAGPEPAGAS